VIPVMLLNKSNSRMSSLRIMGTAKAFGANHLSILWENLHKLHNKSERPKFYFGHPIIPQIKLITSINERTEILPLGFECQFTTQVTKFVRMIETLLWHNKNIINPILLQKDH